MNIIKEIEEVVGIENLEELDIKKSRMVKEPDNFLYIVTFKDKERIFGIGFSASVSMALFNAIECYDNNKKRRYEKEMIDDE